MFLFANSLETNATLVELQLRQILKNRLLSTEQGNWWRETKLEYHMSSGDLNQIERVDIFTYAARWTSRKGAWRQTIFFLLPINFPDKATTFLATLKKTFKLL